MSASKTRWAAPEEWDAQRETITNLYKVQRKTLRELVRIMEEEHHFHATPRMYKARFNKWGLEKNLHFKDVTQLLRDSTERAGVGKDSVRYIRGKQIDETRLKRYFRSLPPEKQNELSQIAHGIETQISAPSSSAVSCRAPSPKPNISHLFSPRCPEGLRLSEECVYAMRCYITGNVDTGTWELKPTVRLGGGNNFPFWNYAKTSKKLLQEGHTKQAFRTLQSCFHEYKGLLEAQHPSLFVETCIVGLFFVDGFPEVYASLLRYITALAKIMLIETHPLHILFTNLYRIGSEGGGQNLTQLSRFFLDICQPDPEGITMVDCESVRDVALMEMGYQSHAAAEAGLLDIIRRLEPYRTDDFMEAKYLDMRDDLSMVYIKWGRPDKARQILEESLQSPVLYKWKILHASVYRNLFLLAINSNSPHEEVLFQGHRLLKFVHAAWGVHDNKTISVIAEFGSYLRRTGEKDLADQMVQNFDEAMDVLNRDVGAIDLSA